MKHLFLLLTFGIILFDVKAQNPEMANAIVHYQFSHVRDTTQRDKPYTEHMVLFLGPTASAYKSYDKKLQDALMRKQVEQQMAEQKDSERLNIKVTNSKPVTRAEYYQFPAQNKLIRKETLITPYVIAEPLPVIGWQIGTDTATFGTLHCQKATGHFKGRDYTAWFCPDLPVHAGPWKLNGLPGLIAEAYDSRREVEFKFDGIEQVTPAAKPVRPAADGPAGPGGNLLRFGPDGDNANADPNLIAVPANAVKTSEREFDKLQAAMRKNPQAFMAAMGGGANGGGMRLQPDGPGGGGGPVRTMITLGPGPVMNNPIELPEKK